MYVAFAERAHEWAGWAFGDLAAAVCRAVEALGPNADAAFVLVGQPSESQLVDVTVAVTSAEEVQRLREIVVAEEYVVRFRGRETPWSWEADINGLRLTVVQVGRS